MGQGAMGNETFHLGPSIHNATEVTAEVVGGQEVIMVIIELPRERP